MLHPSLASWQLAHVRSFVPSLLKNGPERSTFPGLYVLRVPLESWEDCSNVLGGAVGGVVELDPAPPHAVKTDSTNPATAGPIRCRFIAAGALWFSRRSGGKQARLGPVS